MLIEFPKEIRKGTLSNPKKVLRQDYKKLLLKTKKYYSYHYIQINRYFMKILMIMMLILN